MSERLGFVAQFSGQDVPAEFQVFPYGRVEIEGSEPFLVDGEAMNAVVTQFNARGLDMVIDYEHQTEGGDYASPDGQAPAAGWIKALENRGPDGLWARVEWTEKARQYLTNREYRYFSPVFLVSKSGRRLIELLRVALTNAPRLNWIRPIVAKQHNPKGETMEFLKKIAKSLGLPETASEAEVIAALTKTQSAAPELLKLSATSAGLAETATSEEVIAAIKKLKQPVEVIACKDVLDAIGLAATATKSEVVASIHALKQRPGADVLREIAALKAKLAARDRDELVASAIAAGKITPAQKEWAEKYALGDPEGFKLFIAKAPQVVPVGGLPLPTSTGGAKGIEEAQLEINKMMGISDEVWKKHNPPRATTA